MYNFLIQIEMTRTNFYLNACIAFAHNSGLIQEGFSDDYCVKLITGLAEKLTEKVGENADFEPEFAMQ